MEILKFTGNPLVRQTTEAHLITKQSQKGIALNRKGEWGQHLAPKLISEGQEPPPPKFGQLKRVGENHMVTENTRQTKTQTHTHTHAQTDTSTHENAGTTVQTQGSVQLPRPEGGADGQTDERSVLLLLPIPAGQIPVRAPSLAQPAITTAGPACRTTLPAGSAVHPVTVPDTAEIHAVTAANVAKTNVLPAETKIIKENQIFHGPQPIKSNITMNDTTPPPFG